jgi:hypothetical protein
MNRKINIIIFLSNIRSSTPEKQNPDTHGITIFGVHISANTFFIGSSRLSLSTMLVEFQKTNRDINILAKYIFVYHNCKELGC